jgi:hypothetical protein
MTFPGELSRTFLAAGLEDVLEKTLTIRMDFSSFGDYWLPLINGQGTLAAFLSTLPQTVSERVQAAVYQAYLSDQPDGPRSFASVAWAVKGTVPAR